MTRTRTRLTGTLVLAATVALAACIGDTATAPGTTIVSVSPATQAHDEEPPPEEDGEFTVGDQVYCRRGALIAVGPCPTPELVLNCAGPGGEPNTGVIRGQSIRCAAAVSPASATDQVIVTDWTFAASDGSFSLDRRDVDPAFMPDPKLWEGPMLLSGTVTVNATIGGAAKTAFAVLAVADRSWANRAIPSYPSPVDQGQGSLPVNPRADSLLGQTIHHADTSVGFAFNRGSIGTATTGPNQTLWYVNDIPPLFTRTDININNAALVARSAFWEGQLEDNPNRVGGTLCTRSVVTSPLTRSRILNHEGMNFAAGSHAQVFRDAAREMIGPALERIVASDSEFGARWFGALKVALAEVRRRSDQIDASNPVLFGSGCRFNYDYRIQR